MQETCLISSHSFPMPCNSFRVSWPFADGYRSSRWAVTLVHDSGLGNFNQMHGLPLGVGLSFTGSLLHLKYSKTFTIPLNSWTLVMHALPTRASVHLALIFVVVFSSKSTEYPIRQAHGDGRRASPLFSCVQEMDGFYLFLLLRETSLQFI